ncbi:hypothetical protein [Rhizobium halophilum]|uniref:hypothetical protein n=1 Tax=Rhizobium halophilum TaxID=2846852 RepID=UPI001EFD7390|nr:hypothetical protein [Rhizobium halophilum]MCF6368351.1 hypothetical protein [Rhizobium halophilum]
MVTVAAPAWKWEWNLNTVLQMVTLCGLLVGGGMLWERINSGTSSNRADIERIDKRLTAVEVGIRSLDTQELRLSAVEKQASDAAVSMRSLETTLNTLGSDIRVVREILQRIEGDRGPVPRRP